eukprot:scaffold154562_cov24-Tisochrysis_lutea.AAC.2
MSTVRAINALAVKGSDRAMGDAIVTTAGCLRACEPKPEVRLGLAGHSWMSTLLCRSNAHLARAHYWPTNVNACRSNRNARQGLPQSRLCKDGR